MMPLQEAAMEHKKITGMEGMKFKPRKKAVVHRAQCVACGSCTKVCPLRAIKIIRGAYAAVCEKTCVGCGKCRVACSASVIRVEARA